MARNKKHWLKVALLAAFCQVAFLTGALTTQAEEITSETSVSQVSPTSNEVEVQSALSKEAVKEETQSEVIPTTEAPSMNEKTVLDETIGKSQQPGDSPVVAEETTVETPEVQAIPEKENSLEESGSTEINEGTEPVLLEDSKEVTTPIESTKEEMDSNTSLSSEKEEKTALSTESREPELKKVEESGATQKETMKKEVVSPTSPKEDTLIVPQTARSARVRRATNTAVLGGRKIDWGENIGVTSSPNNPNFTLNYMVRFEINGQVAFCIEPGVAAAEGQVYTATALENYLKNSNVRKKTSLISYLGYVTNKDKSDEQYIAAQFMIWEALGTKIPIKNIRIDYDRRKAEIQRLLNNFDVRATFHNQTHTVKIGETLKVKSGNDFLQRVKDIQKPKGVNVSIHGNEAWITVTIEAPEKAKIHFNQIEALGAPLAYRRPGAQTIGVLNPFEPGDSVVNLTILKQGNIRVFKEDAETGVKAQGAASLENAVYGLYQANGKKIKEITLKNINGKVQAEIKDLDPGKYVLKEIKAPKGYVLSDETIEIVVEPGKTVNATAKDQVIKGTIELVKVANKDLVDSTNPDNKPKLAGIEISLTSKTTGQVVKTVVTDKDGYASFGKNTVVFDTYILSETKGKEGYKLFEPFEVTISEQGQTFHYVLEDKVIEQRLKVVKVDQETGKVIPLANTEFKIFDTLANRYVTMEIPNDTETTDIFKTNEKGFFLTNGTLTYGKDRYRLEEIKAPVNYVLNQNPLVFSITNDTEPIKVINFANRQARKNVKLFKYEEWNKQKTPLAGVTFTLYNQAGKALGEYTTDTNGEILVKDLVYGDYYFLENTPLESFQPNTDKQAFTVAFKQNAPDDGETLLVSVRNYLIPPKLETQASNKADGEKVVDPLETIVVKDSVSYTNLFVGKEYTISGVLMNKATNAPILQNGKEIRKTLTFIADKANGTKDLEFVVNASVLKGQTIVVFEKLFRDGIEVAAHADINDDNQSVRVNNPTVHTTAVFEDGLTIADPTGLFTLNDTVEINEILPGKAYLVKGILMDKATGEALLVHGQPVESAVGFIAKAKNETVIVPFTFDLTGLNGREIVVFESLFRNNEELENHKDINDKGQTVRVTNPSVRTTATHKPTGLKVVNPLTKVTITDAVKYYDLIVGKTYTVNGVLMDKSTEKPVLVDGKEVTSTLTFVAETTDGTVNLDFILDARALRGKEVVVFEDLFRKGVLLASHAEITDKDQTIKIVNPTITTKATNKNGGKEILALPNQTVLEWVKVDGLAIGQIYRLIVQGYLTPDGTPFEGTHAEKVFTADKEMMEFLFEFLVDGRNLAGKGLSFVEWLQAKTEDEKETFEEVAKHNVDLTNKDQTVQIVEAPKPPQPVKPEQPQPEVKEAAMVPMLPKTGEQTSSILMVLGLIVLVIVLGITLYKVRKVKD
ncbi:VaFE repeat-containing surface-anchored protein [Enterococcus gallinarum]|uniref:VaFE repeat-containing surface-anchored protein n=1 Tax=Enterococcus gallinarum TaxID=1353 RepID=A0AAE4HV82_ENTGA|nr:MULTISPECIES: VaFE repeat-containing surface-anchored protein [Enterococcus]MDT2316432.1 VaFE repeat-containing surface-anchored protein [Enterococcus faecium]MDT2381638.1 VaFE repeat-containing surface-anchored protein [Enterococcus avium]MDT2686398.1 VaFE repeat-containing surface-anchored protein [Enterococcus gallinarum]MDT2692130.1 VaFE repeat-containing surface-anchored protein [Enterococcus gallinarum]HAP3528499.1 VaFE repeat-containing surface-anchored protein [Enterococcus faecalis